MTGLIAVVDDDTSAREAVAGLVNAFGYMVCLFKCGGDFLRSAERAVAACLIADIQMPDMSGLGLFLALAETGQPLPTILMTAYPNDTLHRRAVKAGISAFLTKPIDPELLLMSIQRALAKADKPSR